MIKLPIDKGVETMKEKTKLTEGLINPIEIYWDLLQIPEEQRSNEASLWDYCELEIEEGFDLYGFIERWFSNGR
jgi:hypothetical protein